MRSIKGLLALYSAETLLAALWIFLTRSESDRAVFLWLSRERIVLLALGLLLFAALLVALLASWLRPALADFVDSALERFCLEGRHLGSLVIFLVTIPLLLLAAAGAIALTPLDYAAYRSWAPNTFPLLHSTLLAILPLLLLTSLMALELAAYLALRDRAAFASPAQWSWSLLGPSLFALLSAILAVFYWLVLVFQLRFFANNPAWYWKFAPIAFTGGDLVFLFAAVLLVALAYWILIVRRRILPGLVLLFVLGLLLQFGVGLMSGGGFASFRDRYFSTYHKTYIAKAASSSVTLLESVQQYEQLYGGRTFTNTKPPGLMVFYIGLDHLISGFPPRVSDTLRYERLSSLVAYAFPVIAMLLLFAVYAFARRFIATPESLSPLLAPFLMVLCPNLVLFSLFPDQAIYPLLFMLGVVFAIFTVRRQSVLLAFVLGLFLYSVVFFAFTMLPLYPFAFIYLALHYWFNRKDRNFGRQVWMALALTLGTLLLYFLFRFTLNYDFLPRFAKTIAINHNFDFYLRVGLRLPTAPESLSTRLAQIAGAAWLNNLDFAAAIGFPIYLLFMVQSVRQLARLVRGSSTPGEVILSSLLLSLIVLMLAGTAQGEIPRLWLFWLPMVVILASLELEPWIQRRPRILLLLGFAQLITIFLTFHFQDFHM